MSREGLSSYVFQVLQWNARSLIANGQEFKKYLDDFDRKPDLICVQESWLKPCLDFVVPGYESEQLDRAQDKAGGGCVIFIQEGVQYQTVSLKSQLECMVVRVWSTQGKINVINFYNPCKHVNTSTLDEILQLVGAPVVWVGDFNAHWKRRVNLIVYKMDLGWVEAQWIQFSSWSQIK